MHEMSTCKQLIKEIEKIAHKHQAHAVHSVELVVGELARVDTNELIELFPLAAENTIAKNTKLHIRAEPIQVSCSHCNKTSEVNAADLSCRHCQSPETILSSGTDMFISHVDFGDDNNE